MFEGYHREFNLKFEETESRLRTALQEQGFGVLTEIDVTAVFKQKLDVDFRPYKILGACHPPSAYKALTLAPEIGLLLPCNVTISQNDDGRILVSAVNAMTMLGIIEHPELVDIAESVNAGLQKALDAI